MPRVIFFITIEVNMYVKRLTIMALLLIQYSAIAADVSQKWFRRHRPTYNTLYSQRYLEVLDRLIGAYNEGPLVADLEEKGLKLAERIYIRVFKLSNIENLTRKRFKRERNYGILEVWIKDRGHYRLFKSYPVIKRSGELGPKFKEGDRQVPEGFYTIAFDRLNFKSRFHLAMNIGYPNAFDRAHHRTGSYIMVHGSNRSIGCLAMGDSQIEEIFTLSEKALKKGKRVIPIHIFPFRLTKENLDLAREFYPEHMAFWQMLKPAYDKFERQHRVAKITIKNGKYIVH